MARFITKHRWKHASQPEVWKLVLTDTDINMDDPLWGGPQTEHFCLSSVLALANRHHHNKAATSQGSRYVR